MKFIDYIESSIIDLQVPFSSKKRLLEQLAIKMGENSKEVAAIYHALVKREKIGVTSLSNGVALPHGKCLDDKEIRVRVMILNKAVNYESVDDCLVQVVVCMVFPHETDESHSLLLKQVGEVFKKHRVYKEIIQAQTAKDVVKILLAETQ